MNRETSNISLFILALAVIAITALSGCVSSGTHKALKDSAEATLRDYERCSGRLSDMDKRLETLVESNALLASRADGLEAARAQCFERFKECEFSIRESEDDCGDSTLALSDTIKELKAERELLAPLVLRAGREARLSLAAEELATDLRIVLAEYTKSGNVSVEVRETAIIIAVVNKLVHRPASSELSGAGIKFLKKVSGSLRRMGYSRVAVESYTDNIEPSGKLKKRFPSNWELSAARAASVAAYLSGPAGMDRSMLSATGFSSSFPVADNATREGRRLNRRLVVVITPAASVAVDGGEAPEPETASQDGSGGITNSGQGL